MTPSGVSPLDHLAFLWQPIFCQRLEMLLCILSSVSTTSSWATLMTLRRNWNAKPSPGRRECSKPLRRRKKKLKNLCNATVLSYGTPLSLRVLGYTAQGQLNLPLFLIPSQVSLTNPSHISDDSGSPHSPQYLLVRTLLAGSDPNPVGTRVQLTTVHLVSICQPMTRRGCFSMPNPT